MKNTKAIILAAGMGKRLGNVSKKTSKPLLMVGGKTLIEHAIDFVRKIGVNEIVVVGGYKYKELKDKVNSLGLNNVKIVENKEYDNQNLLSFLKGLEEVGDNNVLTCNADYIFKSRTAENVSKKLKDFSVYCSYDLSGSDDDVMKVNVGEDGNMIQMSKDLHDFQAIYTGIFYVEDFYIKEIKKISEEIVKKDKKNAIVEYIFGEFNKMGKKIKVEDVGKSDWIEIDTPEELHKAMNILNKNV